MNFKESFSYQFEDVQWPTKLGLGALISLVPILNLAIAGYTVEIIRNVATGEAEPLPHWDNLGGKLRDGFILAVASLIYAVPAILIICLPLSLLALSGYLSQNGTSPELSRSIGMSGTLLLAALVGVLLLYGFVLSIIRPIILILFSREGTLASCFRLREVWNTLTGFPGPFAKIWIVILLAGFCIGLVVGFINVAVTWVPCLGWIVGLLLGAGAAVYILTVEAHLFGQFRITVLGPSHSKINAQSQ